ncbi:hypothetical protein [Phytohabitans rumicis]|uniref:HAF repeat-containing protein n=1 Tax=Phytohabitans rumicis TaxID=1076125 RepID=A0A6V8LDY2_9ACTN|nr:hypothetical protein [Phytohabitans rumicis]GFJ95452.1 hypothetical protein Prum_090940 [Phytohabitans rumicis]
MRRISTATAAVLTIIGAVVIVPGPAAVAAERPRMSEARAVNNAGLVVGSSDTWASDGSIGPTHAVVWSPAGSGYGRPQDLGTLGGLVSKAYAVNDLGEVVGWSHDTGGAPRAFLWSSALGGMTDLGGLPGAISCQAFDINDRSQVVGDCIVRINGFPTQFPVLWSDGQVIDLSAGIGYSRTYGINDRGEVLGTWNGQLVLWSGGERIVLSESLVTNGADVNDRSEAAGTYYDGGDEGRHLARGPEGWYQETVIETLNGPQNNAMDINERGEVVGSSDAGNVTHGYVWDRGVLTEIGTLGGTNSYAYGINDRGEVAGQSHDPAQGLHAFIWYRGAMTDLGVL